MRREALRACHRAAPVHCVSVGTGGARWLDTRRYDRVSMSAYIQGAEASDHSEGGVGSSRFERSLFTDEQAHRMEKPVSRLGPCGVFAVQDRFRAHVEHGA